MTDHESRFNESMRIIRSLGTSFAALVEMRKFAELVVDRIANDPRISDSLRNQFSRSNLHKSLGIIDEKAADFGIPREIPAALRSLQAYGNYGAHCDPENAWPNKRAVDAAMASTELIFEWLPRWLGTSPDEGEGSPQSAPVKLRASVPRPGFFRRQWFWFLAPSYPSTNLSIRKSNGTGERNSIYTYPSEASAGIKRGVLLAFLTDQMDSIFSISRGVVELECEAPLPKKNESFVKAILFISRERPQRVPEFIVQDILSLMRMKDTVSRSVELDEETLDSIALELSRRGFANDINRWFAGNYLGLNHAEIHGLSWLVGGFFMVVLFGVMLAFGRLNKTPSQGAPGAASAATKCVPCAPSPPASGEAR